MASWSGVHRRPPTLPETLVSLSPIAPDVAPSSSVVNASIWLVCPAGAVHDEVFGTEAPRVSHTADTSREPTGTSSSVGVVMPAPVDEAVTLLAPTIGWSWSTSLTLPRSSTWRTGPTLGVTVTVAPRSAVSAIRHHICEVWPLRTAAPRLVQVPESPVPVNWMSSTNAASDPVDVDKSLVYRKVMVCAPDTS